MARSNKHNPKQVIAAIKGSAGIKKTIVERLGISRPTLESYIKKWKTVADAYEEEKETVLDMAESALIKQVRDGDFKATKFLLQTVGKDRGYVYRQENQQIGSNEIVIRYEYEDAPPDNDGGGS